MPNRWFQHQRKIHTAASKTQSETANGNLNAFDVFKGKIFWCNNDGNKQTCCFNHIIGLPVKDGESKPIFDYEIELVNQLDSYKDVWIKKARGLGITEILLRYMAYLCVRTDSFQNKRFHIVTGPRINIAEDLIDRLFVLFDNIPEVQKTIKRVGPIIQINEVTIQAFPSHTVSTMRGYTDVKFILLDEADYFPIGQQLEARAVAEGYRIKTRPWIVMVSTPNRPGGLFDSMERESESNYQRLFYHYTRGIGKIYNPQDIERERQQAYFKREYELAYGYGIGNIFNATVLDAVEELGRGYRNIINRNQEGQQRSLGIDPGFGSSQTAFVVTQFIDQNIVITYSEQFQNASTESMVGHAYRIIQRYNLNNGVNKVFIDGSNPGFIRSLKSALGEYPNYDVYIDKAKADGDRPLFHYMNVIPINFSTQGKPMLSNVKKWVDKGHVAIDPDQHKELMLDLRIAQADEEMKLDKTDNTMDMLDALRLAMEYYVY